MRLETYLDGVAASAIAEALGLSEPAPAMLRPADPKFGDYQLNGAMALAKRLKKNPRELAAPIAEALLKHEAIRAAEVAGPGFVNLTLDDAFLSRLVSEVLSDARDGVPEVEHKRKLVVDFSAPNIAKQMHVGHLRSTIIGDAIISLCRFVGHEVIGDNHIGDWGTQFGLLIVGMRTFGSEEALEKTPIEELERVYKAASARAKEDEAFAAEARAELAKLQAGDADNRRLWERFVAETRKVLDVVYDKLDVTFDAWLGESAYDDALPGVVERCLKAGIAKEDDGAICIFMADLPDAPPDLKKRKEPFIIRKKDGAFLYSTTDIATAFYRKDHFGADKSVYVVGAPQSHHFKQLFAVMQALGLEMEMEHVAFGAVLGPDGKVLRTRSADGRAITLLSLLEEAESRAQAVMGEMQAEGKLRVPPEDLDRVARAVGIGAVKYADLRQNRMSDYQFDWDKMISFSGNSGPYLQYALARCYSIFREGGVEWAGYRAEIALDHPSEAALGRALLRFADVVHRAAETNQPHLLAEHIYGLAKTFGGFFRDCHVLSSEGAQRASRLGLVAATGRQLERGLRLLGIEPVERM
ncbi:MAG: arginine--tRNA ligase [Myxococcales bacterium]|nr:arginine--tRNA ligase [Myxococcales bacterium]